MKTALRLLGMLAAAHPWPGCVQEGPDVCQRADALWSKARSATCQGLDDTCWFCDCSNQGLVVHTTIQGTQVVHSCGPCTDDPQTPQDDCAPQPCEQKVWLNAYDCMKDKPRCEEDARQAAQQACDNTLKERT